MWGARGIVLAAVSLSDDTRLGCDHWTSDEPPFQFDPHVIATGVTNNKSSMWVIRRRPKRCGTPVPSFWRRHLFSKAQRQGMRLPAEGGGVILEPHGMTSSNRYTLRCAFKDPSPRNCCLTAIQGRVHPEKIFHV